ncbi:MAG: allophanate hydrolase [Planctomycetota bacterium]|nr:MAG: allophanate hydrolase [Planctomycetota bacterium]
MSATIESLRSSGLSPEAMIRQAYAALDAYGDPALVITRVDVEENLARARSHAGSDLPLAGMPFVIKDNIDYAGLPTSAGCPGYAYIPQQHATVVQRLLDAGAICIAKVNLDQFATGLVGVRSPYGIPRNPLDAHLIPGGSSSGSAVAVSAGIVPFALGTDTAGSGRVPAVCCRILGCKPSRGLLSTFGVVPAVRSLDCVSIFAHAAADCQELLGLLAAVDEQDPFSRADAQAPQRPLRRLAIPQELEHGGCTATAAAVQAGLAILRDSGIELVPIDWRPFADCARLLYEGPWVAERSAAVGDAIAANCVGLDPTVSAIIAGGHNFSAIDAHRAAYRLAELRAQIAPLWQQVDGLVVPTVPRVPTIAEVAAEPVAANSRLGTYTNFTNLLDLCALALPIDLDNAATPAGLTLLAPAGQDRALLAAAQQLHPRLARRCGARSTPPPVAPASAPSLPGWHEILVLGAHLRGEPLNPRLVALGGRFLAEERLADHYRMYLLDDGPLPKPALLPVAPGAGLAMPAERWALPPAGLAALLAEIPAPLGLGQLRLNNGQTCLGFLASLPANHAYPDITNPQGWRGR